MTKALSIALGCAALSTFASGSPQYRLDALSYTGGSVVPGAIRNNVVVGNAETDDGRVPILWNGLEAGALANNLNYGFLTAAGINRQGVVVGTGGGGRSPLTGLVWKDGAAQALRTEDDDSDTTETLFGSRAVAINDHGTIVGQAETQYGTVGVVWEGEDVRLLMSLNPVEEYQESNALAINNLGQIAGSASLGSVPQAVVWENGGVRVLSGLGSRSAANDINGLGTSVGWTLTSDDSSRAFINDGAATTLLPILAGMAYAEAASINDAGLAVGYSAPAGVEEGVATLWRDGRAYDLNSLLGPDAAGWSLVSATGIDDDGTIVGFGRHNGEFASFRITPVPEPATLAALGLGLTSILRRRKNR